MRRFEYHVGRTHRFWDIAIDETYISTRGGVVGARGRTWRTKRYPSVSKAERAAAKQVAAKSAKGYVELELGVVEGPGGDATLEAQLHEDPSDQATWAVYADLLSLRGDPLGERIVAGLALAGASGIEAARLTARARELDAKLRPNWYGARLQALAARRDFSSFARLEHDALGFICTARIHAPTDEAPVLELLAALLSSPAARFLRRLELSPHGAPRTTWVRAVLERFTTLDEMQSLTELHIGARGCRALELGPLDPILRASPRLAQLTVRGRQLQLDALLHPRLCELDVSIQASELSRVLHDAQLPACTHLRIQSDTWDTHSWNLDGPLLSGRGVPKLRQLALMGGPDNSANFLEVLLASRLLARLEVLSLTHGQLDEIDARRLLESLGQLHHLRYLDLEHNMIMRRACHALEAALPQLSTGTQDIDDEDDYYWDDYYDW